MVSKASEDLPEPESPVKTTSWSRGISTSIFFRLCSRAPRMAMTRASRPPPRSRAPPWPLSRRRALRDLSNRSFIRSRRCRRLEEGSRAAALGPRPLDQYGSEHRKNERRAPVQSARALGLPRQRLGTMAYWPRYHGRIERKEAL